MKVFIFDEFSPQDIAMMQALYSRSSESVVKHAEKVKASGSGKFMEKFYVGYGHASIADCGSTTIFIEDISRIADKAIQDWPLYSGQECSSRYLDFSKREIIDPVGTKESKEILKNWMDFYVRSQPKVEEFLKGKFPMKESEVEAVYDKAIKAKTFDILRGFLPEGITTQLSWHTNLRQAHDKLALLKHHPLEEVRDVALNIEKILKEKYPHSFGHKIYEEQEKYRDILSKKYGYYFDKKCPEFKATSNIKKSEFAKYKDVINKRPIKTNLPQFLAELGNITFDFKLDFGSFRELHRHRWGICRMSLLTTKLGFNKWYLNELPEDVKKEAINLLKEQTKKINKLKVPKEILQYYIANGFNVSCKVTYGIPAAVYVIELRSGKTVHPTFRNLVHKMYGAIKKIFPELKMYADLSPDDWDVRRGLQTITEKK